MFCTTHHRVCPEGFLRRAAGVTFTPAKLALLYRFPPPQGPLPAVAIIELGGGYKMADLQASCAVQGVPVPSVTDVSIRGTKNTPDGDPNGADGEVALDMQCIAGATGGKAPLYMVWAPNDDSGMADALKWIAANATKYNFAAVSISWGQREKGWSATSRSATDAALKLCLEAGVVVFAASGDNGSGDGAAGQNVDYPAASPYCFGCGGTTGQMSGGKLAETVWPETGGGYSSVYPKPLWQAGNTKNLRMVPDGAGVADPSTGYQIRVDGKDQIIGGTSAVAPMFTALAACIAGMGVKLNPTDWWGLPEDAVTDVLIGSNGAYKASKGPDPCTGKGSPVGMNILATLGTTGGGSGGGGGGVAPTITKVLVTYSDGHTVSVPAA